MRRETSFIIGFTVLLIIILDIFHGWLFSLFSTGGDFNFFFQSAFSSQHLYPYAWNTTWNNGLGGLSTPFLWIFADFALPIALLGKIFSLSWPLIAKFSYLYPIIILTPLSAYFLAKNIIASKSLALLASGFYLCNTYALMIFGGGQFLIGLSYAVAPLTLLSFIRITNLISYNDKKRYIQQVFIAGLFLSLQVQLDVRIAYVTMTGVGIYYLLLVIKTLTTANRRSKTISFIFIISGLLVPGIVACLIHAYWLLPTALVGGNPVESLGGAYSTTGAVQYFSFANFENALGLLHPNWPENIFGLTHFMRPEFLLLPILAFSSLLLVGRESRGRKMTVLAFTLIGLIGVFLAKGANDPFGGIYLWMFKHVPGFMLFRDPTKWYTLIAISYSVLIPYSIWRIHDWLKIQDTLRIFNLKFQINFKSQILNLENIFIFLLLLCGLFTIRQAILRQLGGTFESSSIPQEYVNLEQYLSNDRQFYRTLWVPIVQRYAFMSDTHPVISGTDLYNTVDAKYITSSLNSQESFLQNHSVKYVIVPYDSEGTIFLTDRTYDKKKYVATIAALKKVSWLKKIDGFGRIAVFEVPNIKPHFYIANATSSQKVKYREISPVEQRVTIINAHKGDRLVFAESFDNHWEVFNKDFKMTSEKFGSGLNSFVLPKAGSYTLTVYYTVQSLVNVGLVVSIVSFVLVISGVLLLSLRK